MTNLLFDHILQIICDPNMPPNEVGLVAPGEKVQIITPKGEVISARWIRKPQIVRITNLKAKEESNPDAEK